MAERRMFAKTIIDSDAFLDMPATSQLLYFHLAMRADDDGFVNNPKSIMRNVKASEDDLRLLSIKKFIIPFDSGIVVIKHWRIHNYIRKDTYNETKYKLEKSTLMLDENNAYRKIVNDPSTERGRLVDEPSTQDRLGKDRLGKDSIDIDMASPKPTKHKYGEYQNVLLTDEQMEKLRNEFPNDYLQRIDRLSEYMRSTGKRYKDHLATIRSWARREPKTVKENPFADLKGGTNL